MGRPRSSEFERELVADKREGNGFIDGFGGEFGWEESGKRERRRGRENEEVSENGTTHLRFCFCFCSGLGYPAPASNATSDGNIVVTLPS